MQKRILEDLNLEKNICFNQLTQTKDRLHITKSKIVVSSIIEIKEICEIQSVLAKYQDSYHIEISFNEVIINLK